MPPYTTVADSYKGTNEIEGDDIIVRIANPCGERMPFGPGEEWPVRVDRFLEEGVSEKAARHCRR
jgi:hypothetical protein